MIVYLRKVGKIAYSGWHVTVIRAYRGHGLSLGAHYLHWLISQKLTHYPIARWAGQLSPYPGLGLPMLRSTLKRIMTRIALESGRVQKNRQDGNREFISCLACIDALGEKIPPVLVYPGTSGDFWSSWAQDVTPEDDAFFTTSTNGWSSNATASNG